MEAQYICVLLTLIVSALGQDVRETKIFHDVLLQGYNKYTRPGHGLSNHQTHVHLDMNFLSIDGVDMRKQTILLDLSTRLRWKDARLSWNQTKDGQIFSWIEMDINAVWKPVINLMSEHGSRVFISYDNCYAKVSSDGFVQTWPLLHVELDIVIDVSKYPFDTQTFNMIFEPWTYAIEDLDFVINKDFNPFTYMQVSGEWDIEKYDMINETLLYNDGLEYPQVGYQITIKRKVLYYNIHVLAPVLMISLLNVFCFVLPSASGERVGLSMTVFLTLTVYLAALNETLPKTSLGVSIISIYIGLQLIGSASTVIMTVLLIWCQNKGPTAEVPRVLKFVFRLRCKRRITEDYDDESIVDKCACEDKGESFVSQQRSEVNSEEAIKTLKRECHFDYTWERFSAELNIILSWMAIVWNSVLLSVVIIYVSK